MLSSEFLKATLNISQKKIEASFTGNQQKKALKGNLAESRELDEFATVFIS